MSEVLKSIKQTGDYALTVGASKDEKEEVKKLLSENKIEIAKEGSWYLLFKLKK